MTRCFELFEPLETSTKAEGGTPRLTIIMAPPTSVDVAEQVGRRVFPMNRIQQTTNYRTTICVTHLPLTISRY